MTDETMASVTYVAGKHLDEALFDAAAGMADRGGLEAVVGMDEAVRHVETGRVFRLKWSVEEYTPTQALADLSAEVRHGAPEDEDALSAAASLRRSGYEGRLRGLRKHLLYVEEALVYLGVVPDEDPRKRVALPYLERKRASLLRAITEGQEDAC